MEPYLFIDTTDDQANSLGTLSTMTYGRDDGRQVMANAHLSFELKNRVMIIYFYYFTVFFYDNVEICVQLKFLK